MMEGETEGRERSPGFCVSAELDGQSRKREREGGGNKGVGTREGRETLRMIERKREMEKQDERASEGQ